jgi:hypothetical protein
VKQEIHYLNTDLDLVSSQDLEPLAASFGTELVFPLHVDKRDDGRWYATLETEENFSEPECNITAFLEAIEAFDDRARDHWLACESREFNIGYDCGDEPRAFNQGLTAATIARMAALGISLRITLYPTTNSNTGTSEVTHEA